MQALSLIGFSATSEDLAFLHKLTQLTSLDLSRTLNGLKDAKGLAFWLPQLPQLQSLNLSTNHFDSHQVKTLAPSLRKLTQLKRLDLSVNHFGVEGMKALAVSLQELTRLESLNLGANQIGVQGAKALDNSLQRLTQLQMLYLDGNELGGDGAESLTFSLKKLTHLKVLNLADNRIRGNGAKALILSLQKLIHLTLLNLSFNEINFEGAEVLSVLLKKLIHLDSIQLGYNHLCDEGVKALAVGFHQLSQLSYVGLESTYFHMEGAKAIALSIQKLTQLRCLDIRYNAIGTEGAKAIILSLQHLSHLKYLDLSSNQIDREGAKALAVVLQQLVHLKGLGLSGNEIADEGVQTLAKAYEAGAFKNLTRITLDSDAITCVEESLLDTGDAVQIFEAVLNGSTLPFARIMIVGTGGMGKSWLLRRCFLNKPVPPDETRKVTKSIDFLKADKCTEQLGRYTDAGGDEIETVIWDFGGQAVKHGVHEGFYSDNDERTVYLLVVSARRTAGNGKGDIEETTGNGVIYWLKTLAHFVGPKAPVVIAITQCDDYNLTIDGLHVGWQEGDRPIDEPLVWWENSEPMSLKDVPVDRLGNAYGVNLVAIVDNCNATNPNVDGKNVDKNIEALKTAIGRAIQLHTKVMTAKVPQKFRRFVSLVESEFRKPTWTRIEDFKAWCQRDEIGVTSTATQETFLQLLNAHGRLFFFGRSSEHNQDWNQLPAGQRRRMRLKKEFRVGRQLESAIIHSGWMKHCVYQIVDRTPERAWFDFARDIQPLIELATNETGTVRQSSVDDDLILEFLERSELCWYADERLEYLFPRGLRLASPKDWEQWRTWPCAHLKWKFLPEANFFRLLVGLHKTKIDGKGCVMTVGSHYQHGRNWVHIHDFQECPSEAVVVAFHDAGSVEIRFDSSKPGTSEGRKWILTKVQHLMEEIQGLVAEAALVDPMRWKGVLLVNPIPSVVPKSIDLIEDFYRMGLKFEELVEKHGSTTQKDVAKALGVDSGTLTRWKDGIQRFLKEKFKDQITGPLVGGENPGVKLGMLTPIGQEVMRWCEEWYPHLRALRKKVDN